MDEFTNPYRPGAGTNPPALLGRDELIDHFGVAVRRALAGRPGKSVMPIGSAASVRRCCSTDSLREQLGDDYADAAVLHTGPEAYRRQDGIAVIPLGLLGP